MYSAPVNGRFFPSSRRSGISGMVVVLAGRWRRFLVIIVRVSWDCQKMIIENQATVTDAVVEAVNRTEDPRLREILLALVRHLHGFVREIRLSEREFQEATRIIAAMGQKTTSSHNEAVLMAGSLGVSSLVCLLNNGNNGQTETQANLLGPFWRDDQPPSASGATLGGSPTPGAGLLRSAYLL